MKIDDIITLGKMGFTAEQVKQMMQMESPAQPQVQTPTAAPAAPVEAEPASGQRRLHAVRRGESKDA